MKGRVKMMVRGRNGMSDQHNGKPNLGPPGGNWTGPSLMAVGLAVTGRVWPLVLKVWKVASHRSPCYSWESVWVSAATVRRQ